MGLFQMLGAIVLPAIITVFPVKSYGDVFAGAGGGTAQYNYQDVNESVQKKLILGYRFYNHKANAFSGYLELFNMGQADVSWTGRDVFLHMQGGSLLFSYSVLSSRSLTSFMNFKAGVYKIRTEVQDRVDGSADSLGSTGFVLGTSIGTFLMDKRLALHAELMQYFNVKDTQKNNSVMAYSFNAVYYFNDADAQKSHKRIKGSQR
ncbi:MAG: hypothetical protein OEZ68_18535 [Gammaproteobacteria bacterium]|nr:hypothetical protein [Gammaproteobacteria bacterium]MDH5802804.1 hypothetical protein [Gammaproteobacteria bacterium]